jgi:very-short-patch-repair endonuclease
VDVTLVGRQCRAKKGARIHRAGKMDRRDLRHREGLPLTSLARTLIDVAAHVGLDELERLVSAAREKGIQLEELEAALERAGGRRGVSRMRAFLKTEDETGFSRSKGERLLRRLLREARLPQPRRNFQLGPWNVDFLWEREKLIVEFDSFRFHGDRRAFEKDRRKDVELANLGYEVLRFTWRQLRDEPLVVLAAIARALGRRGLAAV